MSYRSPSPWPVFLFLSFHLLLLLLHTLNQPPFTESQKKIKLSTWWAFKAFSTIGLESNWLRCRWPLNNNWKKELFLFLWKYPASLFFFFFFFLLSLLLCVYMRLLDARTDSFKQQHTRLDDQLNIFIFTPSDRGYLLLACLPACGGLLLLVESSL